LIFLDTNVVSELSRQRPNTIVLDWVDVHDRELALSSVVIGEISYGVEQVRKAERAPRLANAVDSLRRRFAGRIFGFDEETAPIYGRIMGEAKRQGRAMSVSDGMIAAIALQHDASLATRNTQHFKVSNLRLVDPWVAAR
jgi:predicted nucleic acid-binding protein